MFLMAVFIVVFSVTEGPLIWIYTAETLHDNQLGIVGIGLTLNLLVIAYITEFIIDWIKPQGLFFIFAGSTLAGGAFIQVFLKETQGLSDADKMTLYLPKDVKDA